MLLKGVNIVGADLVEVSPPYDTSGNTALLGANLLYEMLCVLPGVEVTLEVDGPDAADALDPLADLLAAPGGEDYTI